MKSDSRTRRSRPKTAVAGKLAVITAALLTGCGIYTFSGSTLPSSLKTVDIPQFLNQTLQPGLGEEITNQVNAKVLSGNLLRIVQEKGDATIWGTILSYSHDPRSYSTEGQRRVDVSEYSVRISVEVKFLDNKNGKTLYEGTLSGEGIYDFESGREETGKRMAIDDIVEQIMQNSVQGW